MSVSGQATFSMLQKYCITASIKRDLKIGVFQASSHVAAHSSMKGKGEPDFQGTLHHGILQRVIFFNATQNEARAVSQKN